MMCDVGGLRFCLHGCFLYPKRACVVLVCVVYNVCVTCKTGQAIERRAVVPRPNRQQETLVQNRQRGEDVRPMVNHLRTS